MSLTIKHPESDFSGSHSGIAFADGVAELPALDEAAREPLLANGFTIDGEDDVVETPEEEAARVAAETEKAEAERKAVDEAEAKRLADEKAAAEKAEAEKAAKAKK